MKEENAIKIKGKDFEMIKPQHISAPYGWSKVVDEKGHWIGMIGKEVITRKEFEERYGKSSPPLATE